jgi:hypothetical protein
VVCDLDRFEIHTNFTGTVKKVHGFDLDGLADPANIKLLRCVFTDPDALKPGQTQAAVTKEVADCFAHLAEGMSRRGIPPQHAAHFLMKLMFCMFAEDIDLLPRDLFARTVANSKKDPARLSKLLKSLFDSMAKGEPFGADAIPWFNGGLFADTETIDLTPEEITKLLQAARCDWSSVEPTIFGTLFERTLDPAKRAQIGAHYTSREDIETLLQPVMMAPLRREWEETKLRAEKLWVKVHAEARRQTRKRASDSKARRDFDACLRAFADRLTHITVLDPACGSGNFLYVAIHLLLDLEKEVLTYAANHDISQLPMVSPRQLRGLEINQYAQQLAQVVLWIGYLQWMHFNGFQPRLDPVLDTFENICNTDAILDLTDPKIPKQPDWPEAEFIVGNPPFLGGKKLRSDLGDEYIDCLFAVWRDRVRPEADLCCYWFEKARRQIEDGKTKRAGLLATQGIRGGANRDVLLRIKETGDIFFAESDRNWILDGANVHISFVGFDDGKQMIRLLNGSEVRQINANLSSAADIATASPLAANSSVGFMGDTKVGAFDLEEAEGVAMLWAPLNANGTPNSDVVIPWVNGLDVTRRNRSCWIVDFGIGVSDQKAAIYELPFELVRKRVRPYRATAKSGDRTGVPWWLHQRPRPEMRATIGPLSRFLMTPTVSKHRLFVWADSPTLPDHQLIVFGRSDDYFFGILHSRLHEVWGLALGTRLETRPRYTPTTCFETFPLPTPTAAQQVAVADAAKELDTLRTNWLNPRDWTKTDVLEFLGSVNGPWHRYLHDANACGVGRVRYPRTIAKDATYAAKLKARTLTNLYNELPTWLKNVHRKLDEAVFAAYGWPADLSDEETLARLLELNLSRSATPVT